jgi:hypothetical protein
MSSHPFVFPYIGLGLRDDASIRRLDGAWHADYPDADGRPYLRLAVTDDETTIEEIDEDGRVAAITAATSLADAIGRHGSDALPGDVSRFWFRAIHGAISIWTPLACRADYAFVPALGLARVHLPMPTGSTLPPLRVGALAARLSLAYGADPIPRPGLLLRWGAGRILPTPEPISLHDFVVPGILLEELATALRSVRKTPSIEWRPFADTTQSTTVHSLWPTHRVPDELRRPDLVRFSVVEDFDAPGAPASVMVS